MNDNINKYSDIINMKHHTSLKYPRMSYEARAAQFAPFAALTGFENEVKKTEKIVEEQFDI